MGALVLGVRVMSRDLENSQPDQDKCDHDHHGEPTPQIGCTHASLSVTG